MPVTGMGGIFFRAHDPSGLAQGYRIHLDIETGHTPWQQAAKPTGFQPFAETTTYFPAEKQWMLNLRVTDPGNLIGTLTVAGLEVVTKREWEVPGSGASSACTIPKEIRSSCGNRPMTEAGRGRAGVAACRPARAGRFSRHGALTNAVFAAFGGIAGRDACAAAPPLRRDRR